MTIRKCPRSILILNALLIFSLLLYSVIFFIISTRYSPYRLNHAPLDDAQLHHIYSTGRRTAELIFPICGTVYVIGHLILVFRLLQKRRVPSPHVCLIYFFIQGVILALCTLPFALADPLTSGDYLFPVWRILIYLAVFWVIALFCSFLQKRKRAL